MSPGANTFSNTFLGLLMWSHIKIFNSSRMNLYR